MKKIAVEFSDTCPFGEDHEAVHLVLEKIQKTVENPPTEGLQLTLEPRDRVVLSMALTNFFEKIVLLRETCVSLGIPFPPEMIKDESAAVRLASIITCSEKEN